MSGFQTSLRERSPAVITIVVLSGIYVLYSLINRFITYQRHSRIIKENGCKPYAKYPHKDPIFGLDLFRENVRLSKEGGLWTVAQKRYERIGANTFSQLLLGEEIINTCEPENIKTILATQFKNFELSPRRKESLEPLFGHGIFTSNGATWEASRALLRPNFVRSQIVDLTKLETHVSKLISKIPRDGSTVDLQPLFFMLTMDSATEFLFDHSTNTLGDRDEEAMRGARFSEAFTYATEKGGFILRVGKLANMLPDAELDKSIKFVHEFVGDYVKKAVQKSKSYASGSEKGEEETAERYVFLNELAKTGYGELKIRDELLNILLAGRDTTASLMSWTWYILARRPDVFEKLRAEVSRIGTGLPAFEQMREMKYLQYVLNETLRLYPIVPANGRVAVRDTTLPLGGGPDGKSPILVKKGQQVNYQVYVMHRRKDIYGPDAEEFKPERWEKLRPSWQYLPFNGGPRICIGQQFALTEASYAMIRLLQTFKKVEQREFTPLLELQTLTMAVRAGVKVGLTAA